MRLCDTQTIEGAVAFLTYQPAETPSGGRTPGDALTED